MEEPRIEVTRMSSAPRRADFFAGVLDVAGMDELFRAATDHFPRLVSKYGFAARAHLNQNTPGIRDHDQVLRSLKDTAAFLDLLVQRSLGSLAFSNVAGGLRCPDDLARRGLDRRNAEHDFHRAAPLAHALGFVM